ncbi:MAG: amidohydrolase family protein [Gemmatimonadota bacterium]|nr:amidohydrolase family protein [Gemmatimonadota bacterium]
MSIVPMTADTVMRRAAVLVRDGRIVYVGPENGLRVPRGARVVDGGGGYLIPGLADMHTHLFSDGEEVHDSAGPAELGVMVATGVTAARLMIGTPEQLALREAVRAGTVVGPQLWVASPHFTNRSFENAIVTTTDVEARDGVRRFKREGYDFIKVTFLTAPLWESIVDEAAKQGIRVVGHVEPEVGVLRAAATGQQLEHLDAFLEGALADSAPMNMSLTQGRVFNMRNWPSLDYIDADKVDQLAGAVARSGVYVGPTQNVFNTAFAIGESVDAMTARQDFKHWPPKLRDGYLRAHERYWAAANDSLKTLARRAKFVAVRNQFVKAMQDSGGKLLAGSDTPEWFHLYGYGLHRELRALVEAGLTPYQALVTATRNPAEFLGASQQWGTIEVGKRADLVLVSANPLDDITNTERIRGVAIGGRWLDRATLDQLIVRAARATSGQN